MTLMDKSVLRYDFAPITRSETTDEGFLRVWCRAARTGTQVYRRADGSQVREYRPPEEVGNPESLSSFGMTPVTWTHPPVLLDANNTKQYQIGYSGSQVRYTNGFVEVALVVTDSDSIEKIKRADAQEVSAGYRVDFDPTPGVTPEGEDYVGIQRNIRVNHIAVVPRGRAGPEVRLLLDRLDADGGVAEHDPLEASGHPQQTPCSISMATSKFNLDGLELDLPTESAHAVQSYIRNVEQRADAQIKKAEAERDALQESYNELNHEKELLEGRCDALQELADSREDGDSSETRVDQALIDKLVDQKIRVCTQLAPLFEDEFKFDGLSEAEIYSAGFERLYGEAPGEDLEPGYVRGVVDGYLVTLDAAEGEEEKAEEADTEEEEDEAAPPEDEAKTDAAEGSAVTALKNALSGVSAANGSSSKTARYRADQAEAWKRPLTAHRG